MTLGRKQRTTQQEWWDAVALAWADPSRERADRLVTAAAYRLRDTLDALGATSTVYAWSGGKDSQVCAAIAKAAGYDHRGVCVLTAGLEYPVFDDWVTYMRPNECAVVRTPHDLGWLAAHQHWLFPRTSAESARWFRSVQHTGQRAAMRTWRADALLMGRRIADGNHCGPEGVYRDRAGFWRVSPMYDWSHEDVLTVLAGYRLPLAPCYGWPDGFRVATGPWAKRRRHPDGLAATWQLVRAIDPGVVAAAARAGIHGARSALVTPTEAP